MRKDDTLERRVTSIESRHLARPVTYDGFLDCRLHPELRVVAKRTPSLGKHPNHHPDEAPAGLDFPEALRSTS